MHISLAVQTEIQYPKEILLSLVPFCITRLPQFNNILLKFFDKVDQGDEQKNAQGAFDKIKIWKVKNRITPENIPSMINKERAQIHVSLNN